MREEVLNWWNTLGNNFLMRIVLQGELTTKYHGQFRKTSSLTGREIEEIYKKENGVGDFMCANCGGGFDHITFDEDRDADFCNDCL